MYYYFLKRTIPAALLALLCNVSNASAPTGDLSLNTVVIDAGHGGHDPGAVSRDRRTYEKTLTLDIANRLAGMISDAYPEVNVVRTRTGDSFIPLEDRAVKANKANSNLFISIHINASRSSSPNGYSVHILGQSSVKNRDLFAYNMDVCKRENSVILLEDDYSTRYQGFDPSDPESFIFMQLMQNSNLEQSLDFAQMIYDNLKGGPIRAGRGIWQNPFYVLWKTSMPAVLVELGFISNEDDLSTLRKETNRAKLAGAVFRAFEEYKAAYDSSVSLDKDGKPAAKAEKPAVSAEEQPTRPAVAIPVAAEDVQEGSPATEYGIQIFAGAKKLNPSDPAFKGYRPRVINAGKVYKYVVAITADEAEAKEKLSDVRKKFGDAFAVKISDGKIFPLK